MNLGDIFDEIFEVLGAAGIGLTIPGDGAGARATPPSPHVELPEVVYQSAGKGLHRISDLGLVIVFGPATNPEMFKQALAYASPDGALSVTAALMAHTWTSCDTLFVLRAEPVYDTVHGQNLAIAYNFHLDITGRAG
jgi:hypothetical protein